MDHSKLKLAVAAGEAKAQELGIAVSIAIVDEYGDIVCFSRMEGAIKISPKFALTKAYTAGTIGMSTQDMAPYAVEGKPYYGMDALFGGSLTTIAGGLPVKINDKLVGGVGVGGAADVSLDVQCAQAVLDVLIQS